MTDSATDHGMQPDETVLLKIRRIADEMFDRDGRGAWSTAERIAGALLNNRLDWLPDGYSNVMHALNRLGRVWREAIIEVAVRDWNEGW